MKTRIYATPAIKGLRLWGRPIVITRGGRSVRNSALTKKLTDEFFLQTSLMCLGNLSHIFFWHQAISGHFPRWPPEKLVGTITYEPLVGLHSNLV